jgi:hypothetical protein
VLICSVLSWAHAVELDSLVRTQVLYNIQQAVVGTTQTLLLSDQFVL